MLRVPRKAQLALSGILALSLAEMAYGQDAHFASWFEGLASEARMHPDIDGIAIEYAIEESVPKPSEEEVSSLRSAIGSARDHPLRPELERLERELAATEPPRTHCIVWKLDGDWRWSRDSNRGNMKYYDSAWAHGIAWMLTDEALLVMDQADASSFPQRVDQYEGAMTADMSLLLNGHLSSSYFYYGLDLVPSLHGDRWTVSAKGLAHDFEVVMHARGHWNAAERWGTVDECEYIETRPDGSASRIRVQASGWQRLPGGGPGIAGTVIHSIKNPKIDIVRSLALVSTKQFTRDEFESIVTVPPLVGADPIRGKVDYRQLQDARGEGLNVKNIDADRVTYSESTTIDQSGMHRTELRQIGWVLIAMILAALALLRIYKAQRSQS